MIPFISLTQISGSLPESTKKSNKRGKQVIELFYSMLAFLYSILAFLYLLQLLRLLVI